MNKEFARVDAVYVGAIAQRWEGKPPSAIGKRQVEGRRFLGETGLEGDQQADLSVHGGVDKALHHYAADHYAAFAAEIPEMAAAFKPGAFGENISTLGVTEADLCVGDVLSLGEAQVQVSHGRQPCWKLAAHMAREDMALRVQKTGRTGWYYRVLRPGSIGAGDLLTLEARPRPEWTLARVIAARFDPRLDKEVAAALAELPELAGVWRAAFAKKVDPDFEEDVRRRLEGPTSG